MKKTILVILVLLSLSCSSDASPDVIIGKRMIYKAEYEHTVYEYEINGQCGAQSLEMLSNKYVTETYYSNADCSGFRAVTEWIQVKDGDDVYNIYMTGQTVPERTLVFTGNEIKVTEPGAITVIKYYRRAL